MAHFLSNRVLAVSLAGFACVSACAQHSQTSLQGGWARSSAGWKLLLHSMEVSRSLPVQGVIRRQKPRSDSSMDIQIDQSGDGHVKYEVLSPLSAKGIVSIDNGHEWLTYHPDDKEVTIQPSPRENAEDPHSRIRLAEKNYTVKMEAPTEVAGRRTFTLLASPKNSEMPARRYCIDRDKEYLLRMEIVFHGNRKTILDTKSISFPGDVSDDVFVLRPLPGTRYHDRKGPQRLTNRARANLGFKPALPSTLPYGFVVQEPQVVDSNKCEFLSIRITDGLANATVYEASEKCATKSEWKKRKHDKVVNGIFFRLIGEVPDSVLDQIVESFVNRALKGLRSGMLNVDDSTLAFKEPTGPLKALKCEQKRLLNPSKETVSDAEPLSLVISLIEIEQ